MVDVSEEKGEETMTRVMAIGEIRSAGAGWLETWLRGDDEDPECKVVDECAFVNWNVMIWDGSTVSAPKLKKWYNKPYGMRIWNNKPTETEQKEVPWE